MYIYIHTHTYIYISIVCHSLSNCLSPPPLLVLRPFLNTTERRDILAQNWGSSDYPLQCPWQPIHIWARASARAGRWCFKSSVEGWAPWEPAASLSSLPGVPRSRGEGGIEPLHVSMPRGLKPRPSTSPTHHRSEKSSPLVSPAAWFEPSTSFALPDHDADYWSSRVSHSLKYVLVLSCKQVMIAMCHCHWKNVGKSGHG